MQVIDSRTVTLQDKKKKVELSTLFKKVPLVLSSSILIVIKAITIDITNTSKLSVRNAIK